MNEKQLEQTLSQLAVIAERSDDGIVVIDIHGALRFVNSVCARMHGYQTTDELIGKQISVFHTDHQMKADVIPFIKEVKRRGQLAGPVERMRSDGTVFTAQMKMTTTRDREGETIGLIVFVEDVYGQNPDKQTAELAAINEQLQHKIDQRKHIEQLLRQQIDEHQHLKNES